MLPKNYSLLMNALGYQFRNLSCLTQALTHRSGAPVNNERLEFLGDAVLAMIVAQALFTRFPKAKEGQLSRIRSKLVRGENLAKIAESLNLGEFLILGQGERKTGGHRRLSILEDAMEALIGAIFLDGGLEAAQSVVFRWIEKDLSGLNPEIDGIDSKSALQELLQSRGLKTPKYHLLREDGPDHDRDFYMVCEVESLSLRSEAKAKTRKGAEQKAAEALIGEVRQRL